MTKECIIKVENMTKSFGKDVVLKEINTEIYKGDIIAIIGPSGCGKSTFIRTLNLLEQPTEGAIYVDGARNALTRMICAKAAAMSARTAVWIAARTARNAANARMM